VSKQREEFAAEHLEKGGSAAAALGKRFIAVETVQGKKGAEQYAHGYDTIRQACDALAEATKQGALPEFVLDLEKGVRHDLDIAVAVAPKGVNARMITMPRSEAAALAEYIGAVTRDDIAARAFKRIVAASK
jgi:hypothetical protein